MTDETQKIPSGLLGLLGKAAKKNKDKESVNDRLLPGEIGGRPSEDAKPKRLSFASLGKLRPQALDLKDADHRFDIMPSNAIDERAERKKAAADKKSAAPSTCPGCTDKKCPKCGHAMVAKRTITGDNYRQLYQEQQRNIQKINAALRKLQEMETAKIQGTAVDKANRAQADLYRVQALNLQNELDMWKQRQGASEHDQTNVSGMISQLEAQLNGIPPEYWRR